MGVKNVRDRQSKFLHLAQDPLRGASRINYDCLLRHRIANDRAIATKGRDGKGFSDHAGHNTRMLPSHTLKAQGTVLILVGTLRRAINGSGIAWLYG
jgi:hypothetical protein